MMLGCYCTASVESVFQVGPLLSCGNLFYELVWLDLEEQGHGMKPVQQHLGTACPLVTTLGKILWSWVTAKPGGRRGASPGDPIPRLVGGRNAPESTTPGHVAKVWPHWTSVRGRSSCGRKVFGSLWIKGQDRMSSVKIKSYALKLKAFTQWACGKKPSDTHGRGCHSVS